MTDVIHGHVVLFFFSERDVFTMDDDVILMFCGKSWRKVRPMMVRVEVFLGEDVLVLPLLSTGLSRVALLIV